MAATLPSCAQSFLDDYFARVARNQAEQPHWVTPVATVTPRLEQEFRYDIFWQGHADGKSRMQAAVNCLVIEAMRNFVAGSLRAFHSSSANPYPFSNRIFPFTPIRAEPLNDPPAD